MAISKKDAAGRKAFADSLPKVKAKKAKAKKKTTAAKGKKKLTAAEKASNAAFGKAISKPKKK
jgi:hypothetical protein